MREALDQWDFVIATYAIGVVGTAVLIAYCLTALRRAEKRRDAARGRNDQ